VAQFDTLEGLRHGERGARMGFAEGDPTDAAIPAGSVFTAALVRGLRTGEADTDRDGHVSVDDAHAYVFDQVQAAGAAQTPQRWLYGVEGKILFTRNPAGPSTIPASLPESLRIGLDSPHPGIRMGAVTELGAWLTSGDPARAAAARGHLPEIASADIPRVAATARAFLDTSTAAQPPALAVPAAAPPTPVPPLHLARTTSASPTWTRCSRRSTAPSNDTTWPCSPRPAAALQPGHDTLAPRSSSSPTLSSVNADTIPAIIGQCCDDDWNPPMPRRGQYSCASVRVSRCLRLCRQRAAPSVR
jgi:hypothetical protein